MLTSRCSSGAASASSTPWTIPVNGETKARRSASAAAGDAGWTG